MAIEITARHMHTAGAVQEYAREKGAAIAEEFPGVEHVHVILDIEKHRHIAEVVVQGKNHVRMGARESSDNMRASIDLALDKVEKQLRKMEDKIRDHKLAMKGLEAERTKGAAT